MDDIIIRVLEIVAIIVMALISKYLIPTLKTRVNEDKLQLIFDWAKIFVAAAENIFTEPKSGEAKCESVTKLIVQTAEEFGITISDDQVRAILEAALSELKADGVING